MSGRDSPTCSHCGARCHGVSDLATWCPRCGTLHVTGGNPTVPRLVEENLKLHRHIAELAMERDELLAIAEKSGI
jgi:tRNA(Ile2) C34 agmatinyltransferase TiaS